MPHILVVNLNDFSICKTQLETEIKLEEGGPIGFGMFERLLKDGSQDISHDFVVVGPTNEELKDYTLVVEFFVIVPTHKLELSYTFKITGFLFEG